MALNKKERIFGRTPYGRTVYSWQPDTSINKNTRNSGRINLEGCTAIPYSQGEDYVTTYMYQIEIVNGLARRFAYVACDYVQ
jgi:hypothetical protein